jgi:predicted transposase YbfD/YdcC
LLLVLSAVLCGANDWNEIEDFGHAQLSWLKKFGSFENGVPSHDTINRVFSAIDPIEFSLVFSEWISKLSLSSKNETVAIDGKRICNSYQGTNTKSAIHMVSAYASQRGLCLGQISTHEKSNEIKAIPKLISLLDLKETIITIDAMGCQVKIAEAIIKKDANYILAVKGNQGILKEEIIDITRFNKAISEAEDLDCGHGRIETRKCFVYNNINELSNKADWKDLKSIIKIETIRTIKNTNTTTKETRHYISSINSSAENFNLWIRQHWAIENNLHWNLDVTFKEDHSRKRQKNAAKNFNVILKMALTMLTQDKTTNLSLKRKRTKAANDILFRERLTNF